MNEGCFIALFAEKLLIYAIHIYLFVTVFIYSAFLLLTVYSLSMGKFGLWVIGAIISGMVGINIEIINNKFLPIQITVFIIEIVLYSVLWMKSFNEKRSFSELFNFIMSYKILMLCFAFVTHKKVYIFCSGFLLPIIFNLFKSYIHSKNSVQNFSFIFLLFYTSMLVYMIRSKTVKDVFVN